MKDIGGIALKIASPGFDGMPDRLILLPNRKLAFVELKHLVKPKTPTRKAKRQLEALVFGILPGPYRSDWRDTS